MLLKDLINVSKQMLGMAGVTFNVDYSCLKPLKSLKTAT